MHKKTFGLIVATLVSQLLSQEILAADSKKPTTTKSADSPGKCVHGCQGYASCKGNGNNSCKGKNDCANTGIVPKECSSKKDEKSCKEVVDKAKNTMCSWFT